MAAAGLESGGRRLRLGRESEHTGKVRPWLEPCVAIYGTALRLVCSSLLRAFPCGSVRTEDARRVEGGNERRGEKGENPQRKWRGDRDGPMGSHLITGRMVKSGEVSWGSGELKQVGVWEGGRPWWKLLFLA